MTKPKPMPKIGKCGCGSADTGWESAFLVGLQHEGGPFCVHCGKCGKEGPIRKTPRGAITAWNKLMRGKG